MYERALSETGLGILKFNLQLEDAIFLPDASTLSVDG